MKLSRSIKAVAVATVAILAIAPSAFATDITGIGSSAVASFMGACKAQYQTATGDTFSYAGTGSGNGKNAINSTPPTATLAYSDSVDSSGAPAGLLHIPAAVWPIAIAYNLNTKRHVQLSIKTISDIFGGKVTMWNDPEIAADNNKQAKTPVYRMNANGTQYKDAKGNPVILAYKSQGAPFTFPNQRITVIFRSGTSGTTNNFTSAMHGTPGSIWTKNGNDSFSAANPFDVTTDPSHFQSASSSPLVADLANRTKYSITYVEASYVAQSANLATASILNNAGNAVLPDAAGAQAQFDDSKLDAATGIVTWNYASVAPAAYPLTAATYALALSKYSSTAIATAVKNQIEYTAFSCYKDASIFPMISISKTSSLGKAILGLTAKIGA
jgi:phosphate transport system substrate-binding protein